MLYYICSTVLSCLSWFSIPFSTYEKDKMIAIKYACIKLCTNLSYRQKYKVVDVVFNEGMF